ncbi:type 1 glutamine amidotransferase domain-containing protein [Fulvivirga lutea]|uniref:Type 1 glutamine amidotransferase n=1 Tax=Fulvivirga lutea TaxID=2810512 RepID=A0A975A1U2_9BACT|nr:type 1 glutamine amidotransferase domain-containing protein [Fulvivirga lutea]QSE98706.1 type 1 glutamine amidotransferase [Fulvivirga lutea]
MNKLKDIKVAILAENGFEEDELMSPMKILKEQGADVTVVSPRKDSIKSWKGENWGVDLKVDKQVQEVSADDFDALLIPGGVANPDLLRRNEDSVEFTKNFFKAGKPIASICHGPQVLIETNALQGRTMTSFSSIKTDLINAGVKWVDKEVVVDSGLVTSRNPGDLEAFNKKMVEEFAEGKHAYQKTV